MKADGKRMDGIMMDEQGEKVERGMGRERGGEREKKSGSIMGLGRSRSF